MVRLNEAEIVPGDPVALEPTRGIESPALIHLEQQLFSRRAPLSKPTQDITFIEAPDRRGEVDAAARQVQSLLDAGFRMRDIVVLMRDIEDYTRLSPPASANTGSVFHRPSP